MSDRVRVYVARQPFTGWLPDRSQQLSFREGSVVTEQSPGGPNRWPDHWRLVGTVDRRTAAMIDTLDNAATLPLLMDRIEPAELPDEQESPAAQTPRRKAGRPGYTVRTFLERWEEAVEAAGGSTDVRDVAPHFRGLGRERGEPYTVSPDWLARLRQKHARGEIPAE